MKQNIVITGAAGFIGGHLMKKLLDEGNQVIGIDNFMHASDNPIKEKVKYGDVRYSQDIDAAIQWSDIVVHCAAQIHVDKSISNPQETIDINVTGTLNVLEACRKYHKRMIFASTSEVYGSSQQVFMDESHQLDAQSPYGASKVAGDRLCKAYRDTYGLDVTILRNFNTFGEFQNEGSYGAVIAIFTRQAFSGLPIQIYGSGTQERDYMHVNDAVAGYKLCIDNPGIDVINIGTGETVSINDLASMIKGLINSKSPIEHIDSRKGEVLRLCANIDKAKGLGFKPSTNFISDLTLYMQWYEHFHTSSFLLK